MHRSMRQEHGSIDSGIKLETSFEACNTAWNDCTFDSVSDALYPLLRRDMTVCLVTDFYPKYNVSLSFHKR